MLSSKLSTALESLADDIQDHAPVQELLAEELHEMLDDPSTDELAREHLEALQGAVEDLKVLMDASNYVDGTMSRDKFNALERIAGNVPALEDYFSTHNAAMFTAADSDVGLAVSQESVFSAVGKSIKWVVQKIKDMLTWIAGMFRKDIWSSPATEAKVAESIRTMVPIVETQSTALESPIADGTLVKQKIQDHNKAYYDRLNTYWNKLCDVHVTKRNLDVLSLDVFTCLVNTMRGFSTDIIRAAAADPDRTTETVKGIHGRGSAYQVNEFIYAIAGRDVVIPENIIGAADMLEEVFDKALVERTTFNHKVDMYHNTLTARSGAFKQVLKDMQLAEKTFYSVTQGQLSRTDVHPEALTMISEMVAAVGKLTNVARRARSLHARMSSDAEIYLRNHVNIAAKASKASGTPKELSDAIQWSTK